MNYRLLVALDVDENYWPRGHEHPPREVALDALNNHADYGGFTLVDAVWVTPDTGISPNPFPGPDAEPPDPMEPDLGRGPLVPQEITDETGPSGP